MLMERLVYQKASYPPAQFQVEDSQSSASPSAGCQILGATATCLSNCLLHIIRGSQRPNIMKIEACLISSITVRMNEVNKLFMPDKLTSCKMCPFNWVASVYGCSDSWSIACIISLVRLSLWTDNLRKRFF